MTDTKVLITKQRSGGCAMIRADITGGVQGDHTWMNVSDHGIVEAAKLARERQIKNGAIADELDRMIAAGETP